MMGGIFWSACIVMLTLRCCHLIVVNGVKLRISPRSHRRTV